MMLKIDDRFKRWMRHRLRDRAYAERVLRAVTEIDDAILVDSWLHAALPEIGEKDVDPKAMIALLKGHDTHNDSDFVVAIFGKWDDCEDLVFPYISYIWGLYHPVTDEDFCNLPKLYEIAFKDIDSDRAINHIRWRWERKPGDEDAEEPVLPGLDSHMINLINTSVDSDVLRVITGRDRKELNILDQEKR